MKRRLKLVALNLAEVALDAARYRVRVAIMRELLAEVRYSVEDAEQKLADMQAAGLRKEDWN